MMKQEDVGMAMNKRVLRKKEQNNCVKEDVETEGAVYDLLLETIEQDPWMEVDKW